MTHRLLPWLTRDLRVVLGEEHVEFMMQLIMSLIDKSVKHVRTLDCVLFKSRGFLRMLIFKEFSLIELETHSTSSFSANIEHSYKVLKLTILHRSDAHA